MALLARINESVLNLLFPRKCVACSREGAWACTECSRGVAPLVQLDPVCALFSFNQPLVRALLHALKYEGIYEAAESLIDIAKATISPEELWSCLKIEHSPLFVAMPSTKSRQGKRGYVQTVYLAQAFSKWLDIPYSENILSRSEGETQVGKTRKQREEAMRNVFEWSKVGEFDGDRQLVLVDDTYTTGATFEAARAVLQLRSKYSVRGLVAAQVL